MKRDSYKSGPKAMHGHKTETHLKSSSGPSQRQLRAGELVRHALVEILREEEIHDEALHGVSITVTEVRCSPDLRHATIFVEPLGAGLLTGVAPEKVQPAIDALNRHAKFMRGVLGRMIDMKFTPGLKFLHDESFNEASRLNALFSRPEVARDLKSDKLLHDDEGEE